MFGSLFSLSNAWLALRSERVPHETSSSHQFKVLAHESFEVKSPLAVFVDVDLHTAKSVSLLTGNADQEHACFDGGN